MAIDGINLLLATQFSNNYAEQNKAKLLWTNPEPSNTFVGQSINVSADEYKILVIEWKQDKSSGGVFDSTCIVDDKNHSVMIMTVPPSDSPALGLSRTFTPITENGITFGAALQKQLLNGDRNTNNDRMIPVCIYGIK